MRQLLKTVLPLLMLCLSTITTWANANESDTPDAQVLFICEHGNVKSLMAASYFNQITRERHLPFTAISRGITPDSTTVPAVIATGLRTEGFDVSAFRPIQVTANDIDSARRVIAISVPSPILVGKNTASIQTWDDVPPATLDFKASSASLKAHIEALLAQLAAPGK